MSQTPVTPKTFKKASQSRINQPSVAPKRLFEHITPVESPVSNVKEEEPEIKKEVEELEVAQGEPEGEAVNAGPGRLDAPVLTVEQQRRWLARTRVDWDGNPDEGAAVLFDELMGVVEGHFPHGHRHFDPSTIDWDLKEPSKSMEKKYQNKANKERKETDKKQKDSE